MKAPEKDKQLQISDNKDNNKEWLISQLVKQYLGARENNSMGKEA